MSDEGVTRYLAPSAPAVPGVDVGVMKLSTAIRIGSIGMRQGPLFFGPEPDQCCAWGAAAIGAGYNRKDLATVDFLKRTFPLPEALANRIHGMNACFRLGPEYTFAGIADWLAAQGL